MVGKVLNAKKPPTSIRLWYTHRMKIVLWSGLFFKCLKEINTISWDGKFVVSV